MTVIRRYKKENKRLDICIDLDPQDPLKHFDCCNGENNSMYQAYRRGEVYGFVLYRLQVCEACKQDDNEIIDSCWGYYGDEGIEQIKEDNNLNSTWKEESI